MQKYKSTFNGYYFLNLSNTQTHTQTTLTGYTISSASWAECHFSVKSLPLRWVLPNFPIRAVVSAFEHTCITV